MLKDHLNLDEAAQLTRHDFNNSFLPFLHDWDLFERLQEEILQALRGGISDHQTRLARCLSIPKSSLLSRLGSLPVMEDWIIYTSVGAAIARQIEANLVPTDEEVLFSFRWNEENPVRMIQHPQEAYGEFRKRSLALLEHYPYAVETDIAAYFENIDLQILRKTLLGLGADHDLVTFLVSRLLRRWTHPSGRGIPQGPWASSYIGNAQLDPIDKEMLRRKYTYIRYQDDMRVFCRDTIEARRAIHDLTCLTRELGLTIQAAKTQIYNRTKASTAWRGYSSWLAELQEEELRKQLEDYFATFGPYDDPGDIDPDLIAVEEEALENLFALVTKNPADSVDRKGLGFVLRKLGQIPSDHAVEYCLDHLTELPDVAPRISKYIRHFSDRKEVQERVFKFASSDDCIYDWEMMHLVAAMLDTQTLISNLSDRVFEIALDRNREVGLRSVCIDLMRNNGSQEIVREICRHLEGEPFEEVRAAIILCSQKLPSPERRGFLRQWKGISPTLDAAVSIASEV